jgi:hypothetical protein
MQAAADPKPSVLVKRVGTAELIGTPNTRTTLGTVKRERAWA